MLGSLSHGKFLFSIFGQGPACAWFGMGLWCGYYWASYRSPCPRTRDRSFRIVSGGSQYWIRSRYSASLFPILAVNATRSIFSQAIITTVQHILKLNGTKMLVNTEKL